MQWLQENWFWLFVLLLFVGMHMGHGHGGHGGHGGRGGHSGHGGHGRPDEPREDAADEERRTDADTRARGDDRGGHHAQH